MEDQLDWHGKPIGAKANEAITYIEQQIQNNGKHDIHPQLPADSLPEIVFDKVTLCEGPSYKLGQQVN